SITIPDYLESRFNDRSHRLRLVAAIALVVFVTIYVSAQIHATGKAFESFLEWEYSTGAIVGFTVVLLYILTGGFLAVVWSDVIQGLLMFLGLTLLPLWAIFKGGGTSELMARAGEIDPNLLTAHGGSGWTMPTILSTIAFVAIGLGFLGSPQIFVRFLALRSESEVKKGAAVALIWTLLADSGAVFAGLFGRALLTAPGQDVTAILGQGAEDVLPLLVEDLFPVLIVGVYVAIVLSAIMSTIDSLLVLAASAAVRDVYQKVLRPDLTDASLTRLARISTFALASLALLIALLVAHYNENQTVFWFVIFGWTGIAATFCPTIMLSLFWPRFTRSGALAAMITGFLCVPLFKFVLYAKGGPLSEFAKLEEMIPAFAGSFLAGIVVSLLTSKEVEGAAAD
ncbi:MAG: sodium/proline symporter, partial [Planctomycetota bacterium]